MSTENPPGRPGYELPLLLLAGFRSLVDGVHAELARQGHPDVRPLHGFVFQAIGAAGTSAAELGRRLGISKQAAGKIVGSLDGLGYVSVTADPADGRRKIIRLTSRGVDCLARSAAIFAELRSAWASQLGPGRLRELEDDLREVTPRGPVRLDVPGWFGS
jgi:DNA-binding MarR family transcriptional regulator